MRDEGSSAVAHAARARRRALLRAGAAAVLAATALAGCGAGVPGQGRTVTVTVTSDPATAAGPSAPDQHGGTGQPARHTTPQTTSPATPWPTEAAREATAFTEGFATVQQRLSGPASVALVPVGGGRVLAAGDPDTGVAWSTSKVPLAIAALRESGSAATKERVTAAIRDSDNPTAARLWEGLGGGRQAAAKMQAVLRDAGDTKTEVPPGKSRPPYSSFGQTQWGTEQSAGFAAFLPCLPGAGPVLSHMRRVSATQQWGFWHVDGAAVKGGWGPVGDGYLVRQIAVVPVAGGGSVGASMLVMSPTLEEGQRDLDAVADWAAAFAEPMGSTCSNSGETR